MGYQKVFTLKIKTDNAAFNEEGGPKAEVAWILRRLASHILDSQATDGTVQDSNGNTVGSWKAS